MNLQQFIEEKIKEFEENGNLKTQEQKWTCDAECGVDREKIKSFLTQALQECSTATIDAMRGEPPADELTKMLFFSLNEINEMIEFLNNSRVKNGKVLTPPAIRE